MNHTQKKTFQNNNTKRIRTLKDDHNGELRTTRGFSVNASRYGVKDTVLRCDTSKKFKLIEIIIFWDGPYVYQEFRLNLGKSIV